MKLTKISVTEESSPLAGEGGSAGRQGGQIAGGVTFAEEMAEEPKSQCNEFK